VLACHHEPEPSASCCPDTSGNAPRTCPRSRTRVEYPRAARRGGSRDPPAHKRERTPAPPGKAPPARVSVTPTIRCDAFQKSRQRRVDCSYRCRRKKRREARSPIRPLACEASAAPCHPAGAGRRCASNARGVIQLTGEGAAGSKVSHVSPSEGKSVEPAGGAPAPPNTSARSVSSAIVTRSLLLLVQGGSDVGDH
jgi:hypothetical protein